MGELIYKPELKTALDAIDAKIKKLLLKRSLLEKDPKNANKQGSIFKYTPQTHKKLDKISRDIAELLAEKRALLGSPVAADGYSGRQSNKR